MIKVKSIEYLDLHKPEMYSAEMTYNKRRFRASYDCGTTCVHIQNIDGLSRDILENILPYLQTFFDSIIAMRAVC